MGFSCGIIGLPNVGKSTIFNALTAARAPASNYPFCTIDPNIGFVEVRDRRLAWLAQTLKPPQVVPTTLEFRDIAGLVEGAHQGKGRGNQFLDQIRNTDVLAQVIRFFRDPDVVHVDGEVDPARDMDVLETELILADLQMLDKRLDRARSAAKSLDKTLLHELGMLERLASHMNGGLRAAAWEGFPEEKAWADGLGLLTRKPLFCVANVGEEQLADPAESLAPIAERSGKEGIPVVPICGKVEAEVLDLPEEERGEFLAAYGLEKSGLDRLIEIGYRLLNLVTYYTVVGREMRAWTVPQGTPAPRAAGKIHTDMERGFIRAEVISFEEFRRVGSLTKAREEGTIRSEGKDYPIQDGDIVTFRFNV